MDRKSEGVHAFSYIENPHKRYKFYKLFQKFEMFFDEYNF